MIEIIEAKTKKQLKTFVEFPNKLYKDNPYYVPGLTVDELDDLTPETNPAFEFCDAKCLLAYKDGVLAGRMCCIINKAYNDIWGKKRIRFNRFDVIDDIEVTKALFDYLENWARENGLNEINGPIGFCDMDKEGLLVDGFEEMDLFITAYTPKYTMEHLEKLGFTGEVDWIEKQIFMPKELNEKIIKVSNGVIKKLNLHYLNIKTTNDIKPYVSEIFELLNRAYEHSGMYGVVPFTPGLMQLYKDKYFGSINPRYMSIVQNEKNEIVAFGMGIPSLAKAVKKAHGHYLPFGWIHLLHALKHNDTLELALVSVDPEYMNKGLTAVLLTDICKRAAEDGIKIAETGPELEHNVKVQAMWKYFETRQHKRRRCYIKPIENK